MELQGKKVLLTGASGGLGHAMARDLHRAGAQLVLHGRRADLLAALAAEVGGQVVVGDLADRAHLDELCEETADIDVLIANAGISADGRLTATTAEQVDRVLDVNLRAPIQMARFHSTRMVERGSGQLVFISSLAAKATGSGAELYSGTKAGLRLFALGLRDSLAKTGVGVTVVLPGFVSDAGMFAEGGGTVPAYIGTVTPDQVAVATRRGIERNQAEVITASVPVRLGAQLAHVAPNVAARIAEKTPLSQMKPD